MYIYNVRLNLFHLYLPTLKLVSQLLCKYGTADGGLITGCATVVEVVVVVVAGVLLIVVVVPVVVDTLVVVVVVLVALIRTSYQRTNIGLDSCSFTVLYCIFKHSNERALTRLTCSSIRAYRLSTLKNVQQCHL